MNTPPYKTIDIKTYPRRAQFDYFRSLQNPYVGVTADVDVTKLANLCREKKISFYISFMHAAALAADAVPQLRQRIKDGGIIEYEYCGTSHTEKNNSGSYCYCTLFHNMPFDEYLKEAEMAREACRSTDNLEEDDSVDSLYFISAIPGLHYSQLVQPTAGGDESNPRITWGGYKADFGGRLMMPVTLLCNHALVDGPHISEFYTALDEKLSELVSEADN